MKGAKGVTNIKDIYKNKSLIGVIHNLGRKPRKCKCGKGLSFNDETLCKKCVLIKSGLGRHPEKTLLDRGRETRLTPGR